MSVLFFLFPDIQTTINSLGLFLDIVGVVILFKFGLPASISREGAVFLTTAETDEEEKAKANKYDRWSKFGLLLLIGGFALQIASNYF